MKKVWELIHIYLGIFTTAFSLFVCLAPAISMVGVFVGYALVGDTRAMRGCRLRGVAGLYKRVPLFFLFLPC
jgi:hypothetical protein